MLSKIDQLIFSPDSGDSDRLARIFTISLLGGLFAIGVFHWAFFFRFGEMGFDNFDWPKEFRNYSVLRGAMTEGVIPYFVTSSQATDRFLGNPESVLSPQIFLLPFMSVGKFVLVNTLIMYSLGFVGCLLIRRAYQLSILPFTMLFLLFNFNGHITSHLSVGHSMWNGYFLLPFFVLLLLRLVQRDRPVTFATPILLSFVLFGIMLQGSLHIYIWCLMSLALVGLFSRSNLKSVGLAMLFSVALSLSRLLPTAFSFVGWKQSYASGYPTISTFVDALTTVNAHLFEHPRQNIFYDVGWWEHDVYIGYIGVAFLVFFGIYHRFSNIPSVQRYKFQSLDLPLLVITLFSFGLVFDVISDLQIPLLSWAERVPSRFFIIPLVFLVVIASIRMQALLPLFKDNRTIKALLLVGVVVQAHSLAVHSWFWRVDAVEPASVAGNTDFLFNIAGRQDTLYVATVNISAAITAVAVLVLLGLLGWSSLRRRG